MKPNDIAVIGAPFDANSSFLRGPAQAPPLIIDALHSPSANMWTENGIGLDANDRWHILPDIEIQDTTGFDQIETAVSALLQQKQRVITLGGDHAITLATIRAYAKFYDTLSILQIDAHPDLYDELDGNRTSHACPFARIMEEKLVGRLVQVGIRTITGHQREQADKFGVEIIEMREIQKTKELAFDTPLYLTLDLDALDPAFAPGVSHHEPGGLSTRAVLTLIQSIQAPLVGADIVEYNPERDINGVTGMTAAKLLKEIIAKMLSQTTG